VRLTGAGVDETGEVNPTQIRPAIITGHPSRMGPTLSVIFCTFFYIFRFAWVHLYMPTAIRIWNKKKLNQPSKIFDRFLGIWMEVIGSLPAPTCAEGKTGCAE